jgi:hypothetical protein
MHFAALTPQPFTRVDFLYLEGIVHKLSNLRESQGEFHHDFHDKIAGLSVRNSAEAEIGEPHVCRRSPENGKFQRIVRFFRLDSRPRTLTCDLWDKASFLTV